MKEFVDWEISLLYLEENSNFLAAMVGALFSPFTPDAAAVAAPSDGNTNIKI